ncbi:hypothetical protein SAMN05660909_04021 [Chitinophaga terrae (ex Kim and Jung 2007)]|uniref:Uncharacterized protein n=1 Tax=Chitinophaga terrae (ex Kim and Jung 2007) TaxID=408074 RepID=A0A1H4EY64_9BACT|nr:hypothetical protein SAMN05660909_04021 [Chitinophaga terrae (ex Kim and Jung 2007)]
MEHKTEKLLWRAVYTERCTYGSEEDSRKPTIAIWQGAGFLSYLGAKKRHPKYIICRKAVHRYVKFTRKSDAL